MSLNYDGRRRRHSLADRTSRISGIPLTRWLHWSSFVFSTYPTYREREQKHSEKRARGEEVEKKIERKKGKSRWGSATKKFTRDRRDLRRWAHRCVLTTLRYCGRFPLVSRAEEVGGGERAPLVRRDSFLPPSNDPGTSCLLPPFLSDPSPPSIHWIFSGANAAYNPLPLSSSLSTAIA